MILPGTTAPLGPTPAGEQLEVLLRDMTAKQAEQRPTMATVRDALQRLASAGETPQQIRTTTPEMSPVAG